MNGPSALVLVLLAGCGLPCTVDGERVLHGESWAVDCNTCTCDNGTAICTRTACVASCVHEGQSYEEGEEWPAGDGCNTCDCGVDGEVTCTDLACDSGG